VIARAVAAAALLALVTFFGVSNARANHELMGDFRAFYCAGELARAHAFNYDQPAIAPCESRPQPGFFTAGASTSVPAPLPGYAIALFEPLALLPFPAAAVLWGCITLGCVLCACALVAALGWMRIDAAIVLAAILTGAVIVPPGELGGVAFLGLMLLAFGCERDLAPARIAGLLLLAFEPQIALCSYAVLIWRSEYWRELFAAAVVLAAATLFAIGPQAAVAYVAGVLPAHVATELHRAQQYTIGWALVQMGAPSAIAVWTGRVCYLLAIASAALIGKRSSGAVAVVAAAALALAFGPFVHLNHLICALPAALATESSLGLFAALLIAFPPTVLFSQVLLVVVVPVAIYWILRAQDASARASAYAALMGVVIIAAIAAISERVGFSFVTSHVRGNDWAAYVARHDVVNGALIWIVKAPVWAGVALAAFTAIRSATRLQRRGRGNARKRGGRSSRTSAGVLE
jgi:hypothetical protein